MKARASDSGPPLHACGVSAPKARLRAHAGLRRLDAALTLVCAALLLTAGVSQAQTPAADENAPAGRNVAGLLSEVIFRPFGFDDPYSWMVGAGAFYERRLGPSDRLVLGGRLVVHAQYATEPLFETSITTMAGPYVGWEILRSSRGDIALSIVPYFGMVQYWRRFEFDGEVYRASRTAMVLGVTVDLLLGSRMVCGIASEPLLILDREPVAALGQVQRLALRF